MEPQASTIQVIAPSDPTLDWQTLKLQHDETPVGFGDSQMSEIFRSPDGRVKIYFWRRQKDIGILNPNVDEPDGLHKFDVILEGEVDVVDRAGVTHHATAGSVLRYTGHDTGLWRQEGPLTKLAVFVRE